MTTSPNPNPNPNPSINPSDPYMDPHRRFTTYWRLFWNEAEQLYEHDTTAFGESNRQVIAKIIDARTGPQWSPQSEHDDSWRSSVKAYDAWWTRLWDDIERAVSTNEDTLDAAHKRVYLRALKIRRGIRETIAGENPNEAGDMRSHLEGLEQRAKICAQAFEAQMYSRESSVEWRRCGVHDVEFDRRGWSRAQGSGRTV